MEIEPLKDAYWAVVADCLEHFHDHNRAAAWMTSLQLRDVIQSPRHEDAPPPGYDSELFFHAEPFYVACDIAGRELNLDRHRAEYDILVTQRYSVAEELLRRPGKYSPSKYARL